MRMRGWKTLLLLAPFMLAATPVAPKFDIDLKIDPGTLKYAKVEKAMEGKDFVNHVAVYVRFIPVKGNRVFPVFINTKNYLTCPESEKHWLMNDVKVVDDVRREGIKILGFFFDKPDCENPTYHMQAVVADT